MARKYYDKNGNVSKGRRDRTLAQAFSPDDVKDPGNLSDALTRLNTRISDLEANKPQDFVEFDVTTPSSGTIYLSHGFKCAVRWYVVSWKRKTNPGTFSLADVTSQANFVQGVLALSSQVAGQAVIRVEKAPWGNQNDRDSATDDTTVSFGPAPSDTYFQYNNSNVWGGSANLRYVSGQVKHLGTPNHSESRSEFHQQDAYGQSWSQWDGAQTTNTTQTAFSNYIDLSGVSGDCGVTVTVDVTYTHNADGLQAGNFQKKATFKKNSGTLTRVGIDDQTRTALQAGLIPGAGNGVDIVVTSNSRIDVKVTGLDGITVNWTLAATVEVVTDPVPTGRNLFDCDFTTLDLGGNYSAATFLTRTGLTFTRASISTVQTSASTVVDGVQIDAPCIGNLGSTLANRGLVIQGNTRNKLVPNPRNIFASAGWGASGGITTQTYPSLSPSTSGYGGTRIAFSSGGFAPIWDLGADTNENRTWSSWQRSFSTSDLQLEEINAALNAGGVNVVSATTTWTRLKVSRAANRRYHIPSDGRDWSAVITGAQTARARDQYIDFCQVELGPNVTEAIATATTDRSPDMLSRATGSSFVSSTNQIKTYFKFCPKFPTTNQVYYQTAAANGTMAGWYLWSWGANGQNYCYIKDSDKKVYVKIANGVEKVSTNAISWASGDQVEFYIAAGGNVASVLKYKVNGGSWTDLVLATISDTPNPGAGAFRIMSNDNAATADTGHLMCWLNRLTVYDTGAPAGV